MSWSMVDSVFFDIRYFCWFFTFTEKETSTVKLLILISRYDFDTTGYCLPWEK
jgi:hypothetical protein